MNARKSDPYNPWEGIAHHERDVLLRVLTALRQVRYGHVQIVVQDGRVVQIDRLEKERLPVEP